MKIISYSETVHFHWTGPYSGCGYWVKNVACFRLSQSLYSLLFTSIFDSNKRSVDNIARRDVTYTFITAIQIYVHLSLNREKIFVEFSPLNIYNMTNQLDLRDHLRAVYIEATSRCSHFSRFCVDQHNDKSKHSRSSLVFFYGDWMMEWETGNTLIWLNALRNAVWIFCVCVCWFNVHF